MAESNAARALAEIEKDLNRAQGLWRIYATVLSLGYYDAYREHNRVLNQMKEAKLASYARLHFVISVLTVGFAGGVAGGLMAPWIQNAGRNTARRLIAESIRGMGLDVAKKLGRLPADYASAFSDDQRLFLPEVIEPFPFNLKLNLELDLCFQELRDLVDVFYREANRHNWPTSVGELMYRALAAVPLVRDRPEVSDMPKQHDVAREAELGMWIAWATAQDSEYWNKRMRAVIDGVHPNMNAPVPFIDYENQGAALGQLLELNPVAERFAQLWPAIPVTFKVRHTLSYGVVHVDRVLNVNQLRTMRPHGTSMSNLVQVLRFPKNELTRLESLPPRYKR
jgi:hypothetical protein